METGDLRRQKVGNIFVVGNSSNKSVTRSEILVQVLEYHAFSGIVIGLAFASSSESSLITLEVGSSLGDFYEWHL